MPTITDSADATATMTYSGLADTATVTGQVDEEADFHGVVAAMLTVNLDHRPAADATLPAPLRGSEGWRLPIR